MEKHVTLPLLFYAAEGASLKDVAYEKTKKNAFSNMPGASHPKMTKRKNYRKPLPPLNTQRFDCEPVFYISGLCDQRMRLYLALA